MSLLQIEMCIPENCKHFEKYLILSYSKISRKKISRTIYEYLSNIKYHFLICEYVDVNYV